MKKLGHIAREGKKTHRDDARARELFRPFTAEELKDMTSGAARELLGAEEV